MQDPNSLVNLQAQLAAIRNQENELGELSGLLDRVLNKIGQTHYFEKDRYENLMEACLYRVMELSPPLKGLAIPVELRHRCLFVVQHYVQKSSIEKFLKMTRQDNGYSMLSYILCTTDAIHIKKNWGKFGEVVGEICKHYLFTSPNLLARTDEQIREGIKRGEVDLQGLLDGNFVTQFVWPGKPLRKLLFSAENVRRLIACGFNLFDPESKRNFLSKAIAVLHEPNIVSYDAPWHFYKTFCLEGGDTPEERQRVRDAALGDVIAHCKGEIFPLEIPELVEELIRRGATVKSSYVMDIAWLGDRQDLEPKKRIMRAIVDGLKAQQRNNFCKMFLLLTLCARRNTGLPEFPFEIMALIAWWTLEDKQWFTENDMWTFTESARHARAEVVEAIVVRSRRPSAEAPTRGTPEIVEVEKEKEEQEVEVDEQEVRLSPSA